METKAPKFYEPVQGLICIQRPTFPIIAQSSSIVNIFHSATHSLNKIVLIAYAVPGIKLLTEMIASRCSQFNENDKKWQLYKWKNGKTANKKQKRYVWVKI